MKKVISIFTTLLYAGFLFAAQGVMWGEKDIKQVSTEWFDIIYPQACQESAQILYDNADSIYESLSQMYNFPIPCRMTVTLTTVVEMYNAYWSNGYYNRIVLYLAPPIDECNVESDNLLKTFHHELTHAFTYNMKIPYWEWFGRIFGDAAYPFFINVTSGFSEGATVSSESYDGEGRLNDEFAKQIVKQAKIENQFPKFNEVQGSRDIYPSGSFYFFNGAFHDWLQKKYGFEPYRDWWVNCNNAKAITIRGAFKKAYGTNLIDEWNMFIEEYPVPSIPANPVEAGIVQDFYEKESEVYSIYNDQGALPQSLSYSQKGLTYVDDRSGNVYFVPAEKISDSKVKPKKIFSNGYIQSAKQSLDGKLIAVSYYSVNHGAYKFRTQIFDTESKHWFKVNENGLKDGSIITNNGKYYLVGLKFKGEDYKIRITELEFKGKKIVSEREPVFIPYSRVELPAGFTDIQNGNFAFILKDVMDYYLCVANVNGQPTIKIPVPFERMVVRYPSYSMSDNSLYFSWTIPGSMPRLGKYNFNTSNFILDDEDISGGVYYPVKFEDKLVYSGQFYTSNRIFYMDDMADNSEFYEAGDTENPDSDEDEITEIAYTDITQISKKYVQFPYLLKGVVIPFSQVVSYAYGENTESFSLPIGFSYRTNDPWGANYYTFSAGYGLKTNSFGMSFAYNSGTDTPLFNYSVFSSTEVDHYGWKQTELDLSASSTLALGGNASFVILPSASGFIGRYSASKPEAEDKINALKRTDSQVFMLFNQIIGQYESINFTNNLFTNDSVTFMFSTVRKGFDNSYSKKGIQLGFAPYYMHNGTLDGSFVSANTLDIALMARYYIPALIPIHCRENFTYNLPSKIAVGIFGAGPMISGSTHSYLSLPSFAFVTGETVLFAAEIQRVLPFLPFLYFSDVRIGLSGTAGVNYNSNTANDNLRILKLNKYIEEIKNHGFRPYGTISLKGTLDVNPFNIGQLANSNNINNVYAAVNVLISGEKPLFYTNVGFDAKF